MAECDEKSRFAPESDLSITEWRIFSPDGAEVGWIRVPAGFEPWQITSDAVVGVYRDARGVESVRVYGVERS